MKRLLGGAALVVIAVLATATPAFAHAELESTSPESGANLPAGQPPDSVSMTFSEGVQLPENAVQLLNSDGQTVSGVGKAQHGDSDSVVTTALPALDDGTYVVDWHVVSVDSHPIDGAFTFNVGAATGNAKDVAGLVAGKNDHGVGIAFGLTRALGSRRCSCSSAASSSCGCVRPNPATTPASAPCCGCRGWSPS